MILRSDDTRPLAFLIVILVNLPNFFLVHRESADALVREGLTASNALSVSVTFFVALLSIYLLAAAKRLKFEILSGASFWLVCLFVIYLSSTLWSFYPEGTAFRAVELIVFYIVAVFIFTGKRPLHNLYWMMLFQLLLAAIVLAPEGISTLHGGRIVGFMQSNPDSLYAAAFLLLHCHLHRSLALGYFYGLFFLCAFGSTTTFAAFAVGLATYIIYGDAKGVLYLFRIPLVASAVCVCLSFMFYPEFFAALIDILAPLLQKDVNTFYNATGRIELWKFYLTYLKDVPFGIGFWSERLFSAYARVVPWSATNAHNGLMAAWIGAGFPALGCLSLVYVSTITHLRKRDIFFRRIGYSLLVLLFINSMTFVGIGGMFSMWYYILAAIVVLSNLPIRKRIRLKTSSKCSNRGERATDTPIASEAQTARPAYRRYRASG